MSMCKYFHEQKASEETRVRVKCLSHYKTSVINCLIFYIGYFFPKH